MKVELELPPLPDGWATGPVEIRYGVPPRGSLYLWCGEWKPFSTGIVSFWIYAIRKWQPAIVTAGVLAPGWLVIDEDGTYYYGGSKPRWSEDDIEWTGVHLHCLCVLEKPQITGRNAIWEIK